MAIAGYEHLVAIAIVGLTIACMVNLFIKVIFGEEDESTDALREQKLDPGEEDSKKQRTA